MTCLKSSIKEIIQKVLISSGEPFHTSDLVLELIYDYIRINANQMLFYLSTTKLPELYDLLNLCKHQPIRLIRIVKYFRTICTSSFIKTNGLGIMNEKQLSSFINNHDDNNDDRRDDDVDDDDSRDDDDDDDDENIRKPNNMLPNSKCFNSFLPHNNSNWIRLNKLFHQLSIPLPTIQHHKDNPFWQLYPLKFKQIYYQLYKGKLLRLTRIDLMTCNESIEKFLSFHRLRQSASLLNLTKSRNLKKFFYWFYYCTLNNNHDESKITLQTINEQYLKMLHNSMTCSTTTSSTLSSSISSSSSLTIDSTLSSGSSSSSPHEGLHILAYLLNGDILDIIDMILFNRQKLNINLTSPITPIEIKQVLHMFTNILYPRQSSS
ncbi:unnamed protein product [Schistosoma margrebowiei]|uniref:ANK_REP_REGION domain-containing protein n=1 Tax=Schistosoma margrebowiei TaxID=48269 RepID=A0A183MEZ6_9TREM|nr:unnamed protein product [Schistosoma margrebowiei]VDP16266.1 unnamed protein product [Schistosoma margrebowiei]